MVSIGRVAEQLGATIGAKSPNNGGCAFVLHPGLRKSLRHFIRVAAKLSDRPTFPVTGFTLEHSEFSAM
jgi:hypothetical protein